MNTLIDIEKNKYNIFIVIYFKNLGILIHWKKVT